MTADPEFLLGIKIGPKISPSPHPTPLKLKTTISKIFS
jgi:hypothetical protein